MSFMHMKYSKNEMWHMVGYGESV